MFGAPPVFVLALACWAVAALGAWLVLSFIPAPYGRLARPGWGPGLPPRVAWFLMELPGCAIFVVVLLASLPASPVVLVFATCWIGHYAYRALLYPLLTRSTRSVPAVMVLLAVGFHAVNTTLQAWEIFRLRAAPTAAWLGDPRFLVGLVLFVAGFTVAARADARLRALRQTPGAEYHVPRGGMFEHVSCPNYLGEVVEWAGWALLTWSWCGLVFALWTIANLAPRARALHRWYRQTFPDYPPNRTALVPAICLKRRCGRTPT